MNIIGGIFDSMNGDVKFYSLQDVKSKVTGKKGLFKNLRGKVDSFKESWRYSRQIKVKGNYITRMRRAMHRYRKVNYTEQLKELEKELKIAQDSRASQLVINNISSQIASLKQQMKNMDNSIIDTIQQRVANMKEARERTRGSNEYRDAEKEYEKLQKERRKKEQKTDTQQENTEQKTDNQQIDDGLSQTKGEEIQPVTENNSTLVAEDSMPSNSGSPGTEEVQTEEDTTLDEQLQEALKKVGEKVENIIENEKTTKEEEEKIARSATISNIDKSLMQTWQQLGLTLNENLNKIIQAYQQGMVAVTAEAFKGYQEVIAELENSLNKEIIARQDFQEKYKNATKRSIALADENEELRNQNETLTNNLNTKTEENNNLKNESFKLNQQLGRANEEKHVLNARLENAQKDSQTLKEQLGQKTNENENLKGLLKDSKDQLATADKTIQEQNEMITSLQANIDHISEQSAELLKLVNGFSIGYSEKMKDIMNDFSIGYENIDKMNNNEIVDGGQKTFSGKSGK